MLVKPIKILQKHRMQPLNMIYGKLLNIFQRIRGVRYGNQRSQGSNFHAYVLFAITGSELCQLLPNVSILHCAPE
jgi:hypothetical protein